MIVVWLIVIVLSVVYVKPFLGVVVQIVGSVVDDLGCAGVRKLYVVVFPSGGGGLIHANHCT